MHRRGAIGVWLQSSCRCERPPGRAVQVCYVKVPRGLARCCLSSKAVPSVLVHMGLHSPAAAMLAHCDSFSSTSTAPLTASLPHISCRQDEADRSHALSSDHHRICECLWCMQRSKAGHRTLCCVAIARIPELQCCCQQITFCPAQACLNGLRLLWQRIHDARGCSRHSSERQRAVMKAIPPQSCGQQ